MKSRKSSTFIQSTLYFHVGKKKTKYAIKSTLMLQKDVAIDQVIQKYFFFGVIIVCAICVKQEL